jgi:hypothetical protein
MIRRIAPLMAALAAVSSAARADTVHGTRFETRDLAHTIDVRIDRGFASLVVRRTVGNPGVRHDQATFWIDVPDSAVATRLRSMGTRGDDHTWFEGELMEAQEAARKYTELTGIGGYYPKDPALLSWRTQSTLALQVFPIAPAGVKTVEYTFKMPARYRDGQYEILLPAMGTPQVAADATLRAVHEIDDLRIDDRPVLPGTHVALDRAVRLAIVPRGASRLGGALASLKIARGRFLTHARVEAAARLSDTPKGARIVVLVDASRSMAPEQLTAALAAARAWLSEFQEAQAEVIAYDREPHPLMGKLEPVTDVIAKLTSTRLERRNGSHLDAALLAANAMLGNAPARAPTRILVLSDLRMRSAATPESFKPLAARTGAIVHISTIRSGSPGLQRQDDDDWSAVARPTGGLLWSAQCDDAALSADQRAVFEELARPVRIHKFVVDAQQWAEGTIAAPQDLAEGEGFEDLRIGPAQVQTLQVTGELWSRPVRLTITPDADETKRWAAFAFGSRLESELTEAEMMVLARRGGAVSPVTSYLAIESGVRPSTEGLEYGSGQGRLAGSHRTSPPTIRMGLATMRERFDHEAWLKAELKRGLTQCGGSSAMVTLETTSREIVEVSQVTITPAGSSVAETCLRNAAWAVELPEPFDRVSSRTFRVAI